MAVRSITSTQQRIIEELTTNRDRLALSVSDKEIALKALKPKAEYYLYMQRRILADERVMESWKKFLAIIKLSSENDIEGVTK